MNIQNYKEDSPINTPGFVQGMPAEIYHAHDSVSNSGLKLVNRSPAHFRYPPERESTRAMVVGSALHMACLEPDLFYDNYTLLRNVKARTEKAYKEAKEEYGEENVLVMSEIVKVEGIMQSLRRNTEALKLLEQDGWNELSGFVHDPETGIMCRHRFDKLTKNAVAIDLKTTTDARPSAFSRSAMNFGYHVQDAFYTDQFRWITGDELASFAFIVVEVDSPYAVKIYYLGDESRCLGRDTFRKGLNAYAYCKDMDEWPAYNNEPEEINVPQWALNAYDESIVESMIFTGDD